MRIIRSSCNTGRKMGFIGVASWKLLPILLLVLLDYGCDAGKIGGQEHLDNVVPIKVNKNFQSPFSNGEIKDDMNQKDPSQMIFFTAKDLKVGKKMPIYFPKKDTSSSPHLLTREEAASIPFKLKQLPELLKLFSLSQDSPQAKAMEYTLGTCEVDPIKGETKFCATSLESMLDFTRDMFGLESRFSVATTTFLTNSGTSFQNYTILEVPKEILAPKMVACHTMPYPYAVYYCHHQKSESKLYKILLGGDNGDNVEAVAVCHMDTSNWSRNHASFRVLRIEPGTLPVCHFFPTDHLVWFPTPTMI